MLLLLQSIAFFLSVVVKAWENQPQRFQSLLIVLLMRLLSSQMFCRTSKWLNGIALYRKPISELWSVAFHMGSPVTWHRWMHPTITPVRHAGTGLQCENLVEFFTSLGNLPQPLWPSTPIEALAWLLVVQQCLLQQQLLLYFNPNYLHTIGPNCATWHLQIRNVAHAHKIEVKFCLLGQHWVANIEVITAFLLKWFFVYFFVLVLRYNKTNSDWRHRSSLTIFCSQFVKCFSRPSASREHFTNFWQKMFNDDLDASHYLFA